MRIAYFSPMPPQRSGIADYSEELLPALAERFEVECFTERPTESAGVSATGLPMHGYRDWESLRDGFDLAVYHLGNNPDYHSEIYRQLARFPGVVVLHEFMLHHLMQGLTVARGDMERYVEEMRYAYGRTGERLARREVGTGVPVDGWRYPLFERVVDRSLAVIVHNESARQRLLASRPDALVECVPFHLGIESPPAEPPASIRDRFGIPESAFLVGSFGFITEHKRLEVSLRAFAELRRRHPESRYLVVGEVSPYYDLDELLGDGLGDGVVMTGRVELSVLLASMNACDVAVNLRYPTGGETSATLMRLLGLGRPVIVSDHGSFAEVPDGCCAKVAIDESEVAVLAEYLTAMAGDEELRRRMGANARHLMREEHTLERSAAAYAAFLERVAASDRGPFAAMPPLSAPPSSAWESLTAEVAAAIADLGVADHDRAVLEEVALTMTDVGIGPGVAGAEFD